MAFMAEQHLQRRLAAILAADVVGYSGLMERDEAGTLAALTRQCGPLGLTPGGGAVLKGACLLRLPWVRTSWARRHDGEDSFRS